MDSLLQEFSQARSAYIDHMRSGLVDLQPHAAVAAEVLIKPDGRDAPEPFCLMRVDALYKDDGDTSVARFAELTADRVELRGQTERGLQVRIESIAWESLTVTFDLDGFDVGALRDWYARWLDVEEARAEGVDGLSGVVHDLSWSSRSDGHWQLRVDLGSAELAALTDFLDALSDAGVVSCCIAQPAVEDA